MHIFGNIFHETMHLAAGEDSLFQLFNLNLSIKLKSNSFNFLKKKDMIEKCR